MKYFSHLRFLLQTRGDAAILKARERLSVSLDPAYKHLLTDIGHLEEGIKMLVNMRKDLLVSCICFLFTVREINAAISCWPLWLSRHDMIGNSGLKGCLGNGHIFIKRRLLLVAGDFQFIPSCENFSQILLFHVSCSVFSS